MRAAGVGATAEWLTRDGQGGRGPKEARPRSTRTATAPRAYGDPAPWLTEADSPLGRLRYALPPVSFAGGPVDWARPPGLWGADSPRWAE